MDDGALYFRRAVDSRYRFLVDDDVPASNRPGAVHRGEKPVRNLLRAINPHFRLHLHERYVNRYVDLGARVPRFLEPLADFLHEPPCICLFFSDYREPAVRKIEGNQRRIRFREELADERDAPVHLRAAVYLAELPVVVEDEPKNQAASFPGKLAEYVPERFLVEKTASRLDVYRGILEREADYDD